MALQLLHAPPPGSPAAAATAVPSSSGVGDPEADGRAGRGIAPPSSVAEGARAEGARADVALQRSPASPTKRGLKRLLQKQAGSSVAVGSEAEQKREIGGGSEAAGGPVRFGV